MNTINVFGLKFFYRDIHYKTRMLSEGGDKDMQDETFFFFFDKKDKNGKRD